MNQYLAEQTIFEWMSDEWFTFPTAALIASLRSTTPPPSQGFPVN